MISNRHAKFILAKQEGQKGFYAGVVLRLEFGSLLEIQYESSCDPKWEVAVKCGINYCLERLIQTKGETAFKIVVEEVWSNPVDTTEMTVAYAAAHALWDAIETNSPFPVNFDLAREKFTL
jgi:hypothetical protein